MEINPYAPPQSDIQLIPDTDVAKAEALRREHINTEATIKSVGILYYLGALVLLGLGVSGLMGNQTEEGIDPRIMGGIFTILGIGQGFVAYGLRRLRGWARIPTLLFSMIGLIGFPIGTLINAYIIFQVMGKKGSFVTSAEYQAIIAATPHVKRKTSIVVWIVLIILILVLVGSIFFGIMNA